MDIVQVALNGSIAALILITAVLSALRLDSAPERYMFIFAATCLAVHRFALAYYLYFTQSAGFQSTPIAVLLNIVTILALVAFNSLLIMPRK